MTDIEPPGLDGHASRPDWRPLVRARLATLQLSPTRELDVVDELSQHLDDRHAALVSAGASSEDATRRLVAELADQEALAARLRPLQRFRAVADLPAGGTTWSLSGLGLDLRQAARGLRKDWTFSLVVIVTLALCIGANTAIFSAVQAILIRPLGFADSSRVVNVWLTRSLRPQWHFRVPPADVRVLTRTAQAFEAIGVYDTDAMNLTGAGGPEEISTGVVSASLLRLLRVEPAIGRLLEAADEEPGQGQVVLLGDALWRRRFAADPAVIGTVLRLNDEPYRIVGVLPAGFAFPGQTSAWIPRDRADDGANGFLAARLRPGVSVERAQADMEVVVAAITGGRPNPGMRFLVEPLQTSLTATASGSWLFLLAAVGCVLAIGCVNVSTLLLGRGLRRRREVDIRLALGATRGQVVRLLAAESACLAAGGGLAALAVAWAGIHVLRAWAPIDTPRLEELVVEPTMLWATLATSAAAACVFGIVPAIEGSRADVRASLMGSGSTAGRARRAARARRGLVVLQIALALVLVTTAALVGRSLIRLTTVDVGFDTARLLTVRLNVPPAGSVGAARRLDLVTRTVDALRALPGVTAATAATGSVMTGLGLPGARRTLAQRLTVDGAASDARREEANLRRVDPAYFATMAIGIRHGRGFTTADRAGAPRVAIVNRAMARAHWGTEPPIGRRFAFERSEGRPQWLEIVGVADDTRDIAPTEAPVPAFFVPLAQDPRGLDADALSLYVRTSAEPLAVADAVREAVWRIDPHQPVAEVSTMALALDRFQSAPRFRTLMLAALAGLGLLLAVVGTHAVMAYAVGERTSEIAVRLALGAERGEIVRMVVGQALRLAGAGVVLGLAASIVTARLMRGLLFEVAPIDPLALTAGAAALVAVVLATCYPLARRAGATDTTRALRGDAPS